MFLAAVMTMKLQDMAAVLSTISIGCARKRRRHKKWSVAAKTVHVGSVIKIFCHSNDSEMNSLSDVRTQERTASHSVWVRFCSHIFPTHETFDKDGIALQRTLRGMEIDRNVTVALRKWMRPDGPSLHGWWWYGFRKSQFWMELEYGWWMRRRRMMMMMVMMMMMMMIAIVVVICPTITHWMQI